MHLKCDDMKTHRQQALDALTWRSLLWLAFLLALFL